MGLVTKKMSKLWGPHLNAIEETLKGSGLKLPHSAASHNQDLPKVVIDEHKASGSRSKAPMFPEDFHDPVASFVGNPKQVPH